MDVDKSDLIERNPAIGYVHQWTSSCFFKGPRLPKDLGIYYSERNSIIGRTCVWLLEGQSYNIAKYDIYFSICHNRRQCEYGFESLDLVVGTSPSKTTYCDCRNSDSDSDSEGCEQYNPWCTRCYGNIDSANDLFDLVNTPENIRFNDIPVNCIIDIVKSVVPVDWDDKNHAKFILRILMETKTEMPYLIENAARHEKTLTEFGEAAEAKRIADHKELEKRHQEYVKSEESRLNTIHSRNLERIEYIKKIETTFRKLADKAEGDAKTEQKKKIDAEIERLNVESDKITNERLKLAKLLEETS
jgi:hypothetical protein